MRELRRYILIAALVFGLPLLLVAANVTFRDRGLELAADPPEVRLEALRAHWRLRLPDGDGPAPLALLLSGCDGPADNLDSYADILDAMGWASLILDSHSPRGLDQLQAWRLVCVGQVLSGAERAGDVAVAVAAMAQDPRIDGGRMVILGASHGGWAGLEYLAHLGRALPPPGLSAWPEPRRDSAARVQGAFLLYPYCGLFNRADTQGIQRMIPLRFVLAEHDRIVENESCLALVDALRADGQEVALDVIEGVDHGFDQQRKAPGSLLVYDEGAAARVDAMLAAFIASLPEPVVRP
ncbi:MAG: dienelactone hydrolase family protein [Paracoccus sp. (in: a-proteobacteria)]|nr:dienelactone hydrolase family protein [Paracoccus sp. (in: a-proteobacteria)]